MWLRLAAMAALTAVLCVDAHAQSRDVSEEGSEHPVVSLDEAFTRVAAAHPALRLVDGQGEILRAQADRAALRPPLVLGASVENALGSGAASTFRQAEISLTLASVLERGGKLDARRSLAASRIDALAIERETRRLDLLAEVARRYLAIVGVRSQRDIATFDIDQRTRAVGAAQRRLQAGASPESVVLTAQAALARAELERARADQRLIAARQHLAALWGERSPRFVAAAGDPFALPAIADFSELARLLDDTPELAQFADEARIREARLQLARSQATPDLDWQVGVRRLQETDDFAVLASVSLPLGSQRRAGPDIRAAEAELTQVGIEHEVKGLSLYSTLVDAHGRYRVAELEVRRLQTDVLPKLASAETAAEHAWRAGATSYLEWATLQAERTAARKQRLEAALDAQRALIEIQRLTGQAFVTSTTTTSQDTTP